VIDDLPAATCDDVGKTLAPDDGDAEQVNDSGEDAAVCTYTITIAAADAPKLTNSVTVTVSDGDGNTGSDSDTATINIP
jgi:hypothetical protein